MAITFGGLAKMAVNTSMAVGQASAQSQGLDKESGSLMGMTDLLNKDSKSTDLVSATLDRMQGGSGKKDNSLFETNKAVLGSVFGTTV